jgi:hypothetical protein
VQALFAAAEVRILLVKQHLRVCMYRDRTYKTLFCAGGDRGELLPLTKSRDVDFELFSHVPRRSTSATNSGSAGYENMLLEKNDYDRDYQKHLKWP